MVALTDQASHALNTAVKRLWNALRPSAIYLYGSHAYGVPAHHSDLDLLVVVDESSLTAYERDALAYRALGDIRFPIDVQVYTVEEFERRAALPRTVEANIKKRGVRVDAS